MIMTAIRKLFPKPIRNLWHLLLAWFGAVKYRHPSEKILVIGITGTSGKSSTIFFLRQLLEDSGYKVGSLSTIDFYIAGESKLNDQKMTMLGRMQIQKYLRLMVDKGCQIAIVETTSEGAVQYRNRFINYDLMVLTNLYPEHIEAHGSFENYKKAKLGIFNYASRYGNGKKDALKLGFKSLKKDGCSEIKKTVIINGDSEYANEFLNSGRFDQKFIFGYKDDPYQGVDGAFQAKNVAVDDQGLHFEVDQNHFDTKIFGKHNILNILSAITVLRNLGRNWSTIQDSVCTLTTPPGRIEFVNEAEKFGFKIIVDYAFEPVALQALYEVVQLLKPKRVIHVCGSTGGGRDKSRRRPIGRLVGQKADIFIVTDEDPYEEDPLEIMKEVSIGAVESGKIISKNLFEIPNRREAIKKAVEIALPGDLILITGKGSEQAMCVAGDRKILWDDRQIVREFLG